MSKSAIHILPEQEAIKRIVTTIQQVEPGVAPFALVLGSGFSHGLVPTARQIVEESLPLWMECVKTNEPLDVLTGKPANERKDIARKFWEKFVEENGLKDWLNSKTGLPEDYAKAYKFAFDSKYCGALGTPAIARKFQRTLMQSDDRLRLNTAHFLLASLLGVQPSKSRPNDLFKYKAAFSRLILTTNFDPFLQIALQAVNRLYFMSDTPDLGVSDEILDDETEAIHLVYVHGSVHRRLQASNEKQIQVLKKKNSNIMASALKRHGVIVLGYSGWDDVIIEALAACVEFDHDLYWCGREANPVAKGAFGPHVKRILSKETAHYVQIKNAGNFMAHLHMEMVNGLPILDNPFRHLKQMLEMIDLKELEPIAPSVSIDPDIPQPLDGRANPDIFFKKQQEAIERLDRAEQRDSEMSVPETASQSDSTETAITATHSAGITSQVRTLISSVQMAIAVGNYAESLELCSEALGGDNLLPNEQAELLILRGQAFHYLGRIEEALEDYSRVIDDLSDAPVNVVARALVNRGFLWRQRGKTDEAMEDYTHVIDDLPGAPIEYMAQALVNRGFLLGRQTAIDKAMDDYTRVIDDLSGAPIEPVAQALVNRGALWRQQGRTDKEMEDYSRVINDSRSTPVKQLAQALVNRGVLLGQQGAIDKAMEDYIRVIDDLPGAPIEPVAQALVNRGFLLGQQGRTDKEMEDYTRVINDLPGVPVRPLARALINRGVLWKEQGNSDKAMEDYTRVIEDLPDAPVELVAQTLINRGVLWSEQGKTDMAMEDYTRVIEEFPDTPVEMVAQVLAERGWYYYERNAYPEFLADTEAALSKNSELDFARFNLGLALLACGRDEEALVAYRRAGEKFPMSIETLGVEDLIESQQTWLTAERAEPVVQLLRSLKG